MATLAYVFVPVTIHVIYNPAASIPASTDTDIYVRSGQNFDHAVEVKTLSGKNVLGYWWTVPTFRSGFRDTFEFLTVEKPQDDDIQVRGTTIAGANADVNTVIHVLYAA